MDDAPSGALPRYQQISELLIRDIAAGRLMDGARLAPEREMAADLGVAVGTLRKALQDLAEKGLLERVQGSGNYIRAQPEVASIYALFRLELVAGGGLPSAEVLEVTRCAKPAHLPEFGSGAEAHRIRRLRLLSGQPAAVEEIWLDAAYAPELRADELSQSLYLHYRTRLGLWIARAEDRIGTGTVPKNSRRRVSGCAPARWPGIFSVSVGAKTTGARKCRKPGLTRMWRDMCRA